MKTRVILRKIGFGLAILAVIAVWAFPFLWMFLGSLKPTQVIISTEIVWRFQPTLEHYRTIFMKYPFLRFIFNSFLVGFTVTAVTMVAGGLTAYGISRFDIGGKPFRLWILLTRMLPSPVLVIPLFLLFRSLDLINTLTALVIADTTFLLSFAIWILRSFFDEVPEALEEQALVDGGTRFQALVRVIMPLARPGFITTSILTFIFAWNEYLFALVFATATSVKTLPVAAGDFITGYAINWGPVFASGTLIVLPVFILSVFLQRYIVRGLTLGAIK
ncbi:MAG: carbohydrate ABC transporter permease [Bacteroidota bacterium]